MKQLKASNLSRLLNYFRPYWGRLAFCFVCVSVVGAASGGTAYLIKPAMDEVFIKQDEQMLYWICVAAVLIYAAKGIFRFLNAYILRTTGQKVINTIRDELYSKYQYLSIDYYNETQTGVMMSRITNDVHLMQRAVPSIVDFIRQPITMLGLVGVAVYMNWKMSLIAIVVLSISAYPIARFGRGVRKYAKRGQERMGELTSILKENFSGIRIIKAFGMEEYEIKRFSKENRRVLSMMMKQIKYDELAAPVIEFLGALATAGVLFYGAMMVFRAEITTGSFFSFLAACGMMYEPVKKLNKVNVAFNQALAATDRIFEILDTSETITDKPEAIDLGKAKGEVHFDGVRFRYDTDWVLKGIDLAVEPGKTIALVGSSGAGKTTLVDLIPRFFDVVEGAIRVDGHDIRDLTMKSLRRQIAVVNQEVFLFDDTVAGNIAYGVEDADLKGIEEAARAANAHQFIQELPHGYDSRIGEQGVRLSGGQRQRISIARALYKNAPILILDEATSSLDTESEREVQAALENLMKGRTTFVIAHRLSTIRNADRILVLDQGRIAEDGRHEELMAKKNLYHRLYQLQFREE